MNALLVAPVVWPLATAAILVLLQGRLPAQRALSTASAAAGFTLAAVLLAQVAPRASWSCSSVAGTRRSGSASSPTTWRRSWCWSTASWRRAVAVYALRDIDADRERLGYHPMFHVLLAGVNGAFLTGDLFNLYVWFELLLIASFVLLTLGNRREQLEGGVKYVAANLVVLHAAADRHRPGLRGHRHPQHGRPGAEAPRCPPASPPRSRCSSWWRSASRRRSSRCSSGCRPRTTRRPWRSRRCSAAC
jgi:formate hydrogenlyase subunit 3/multisubunit Na+/H+ antiporter MnhD subunit